MNKTSLVTALLLALGLSACATRELAVPYQVALNRCEGLHPSARGLCREVTARRMSAYQRFSRVGSAELRTLNLAHESLNRTIAKACKTAADSCTNLRKRLEVVDRRHQSVHRRKARASEMMYEALLRTPAALADAPQKIPQVYCAERDSGGMDCIAVDALVATFDAEMAIDLLRDLAVTADWHRLDAGSDALVECNTSGVTALESDEEEEEERESLRVDETMVERAEEACRKLRASGVGAGAGGLTLPAGHSGVTNVGALFGHVASACGALGTPSAGLGEFMKQATEVYDRATAFCGSHPLAEGGSSEEDKAENPPKQEYEQPSEDAEETSKEESVEYENGYTIQVTRVTYSDSTSVEIRTNVQTGVTTSTTTFHDAGGATSTRETGPHADGGTYTTVSNSDSPGVETTTYSNSPDHSYTTDDKGNSWSDGPGTTIYEDRWGNQWIHFKDRDETKFIPTRETWADCAADEPCGTCGAFAGSSADLMDACMAPGSASPGCGNWAAAAACCTHPLVYPQGPGLVLTDDSGRYMCAGGNVDAELQRRSCETECKQARDPEDCLDACSNPTRLFPGIRDICPYVQSNDCGSGPGGLPTLDSAFLKLLGPSSAYNEHWIFGASP